MAGKKGSGTRKRGAKGPRKAARPRKTGGAGARVAPRRTGGDDSPRWTIAAAVLVLAVLALRLGINALELVPVHFDEAQYWAYGQELDWGYFSKPPGVAAVIRIATDLGGDTLFALRFSSALAHAAIAAMLFLLGRRLFDAATGFWAATAYTAAPGVSVSAMIMSTDPVMMVAWAGAMLAWVAATEHGRARGWWVYWALMGVLIGLGTHAKYTMLVMPAAALAYGLFSARGRDWRGTGIAAAAALIVIAPNLIWNAANSFATAVHVAEDADPGHGYFNPGKFAEFAGAQLGVIGPVVFLAILAAFWRRRDWIGDWRMRVLAWQTGLLLFAILALAFLTRAQPNWAAPAYVAGSLFAVAWLRQAALGWTLRWQAFLGIVGAVTIYGLGALYAVQAEGLARVADPFKKMRVGTPFCDRALAAMGEEGAEVLLSNDRRRLSECMFLGGLGWDEVAVWHPSGRAQNHHELVAALSPGDGRRLLLAIMGDAAPIAAAFEDARLVDEGRFRTHRDRDYPYSLWVVEGFEGYPDGGPG
ncbi:MAG: glycosyltransferase family 39 protein [Pseudomonadota bacterium]